MKESCISGDGEGGYWCRHGDGDDGNDGLCDGTATTNDYGTGVGYGHTSNHFISSGAGMTDCTGFGKPHLWFTARS